MLRAVECAFGRGLIGAGLCSRRSKAVRGDVGFDKQQIVRFSVVLPASAYQELGRVSQFYQALEARIAQLPGVEAVGTMYGAPMSTGRTGGTVLVEGRPRPAPGEDKGAMIRPMTPGLQRALGLTLVRGRPLTDNDNRGDAEPVALVNEGFVRLHFPNEDPLGRRVRVPG